MTVCAAGGLPIFGSTRLVEAVGEARGMVPMCEMHALTADYARAMCELYPEGDRLFEATADALRRQMQASCPPPLAEPDESLVMDEEGQALLDRLGRGI